MALRCLQIVVVACKTGPGQLLKLGRTQPPQRGADAGPRRVRQCGQHSAQMRQLRLAERRAAGDDADMVHRQRGQFQNTLPQRVIRQKIKHSYGCVIMTALGTKAAIHGAVAAAGVNDGAKIHRASESRLAQTRGLFKKPRIGQGQKC